VTFQRSEKLFERANTIIAGGISSQIRRAERPVPLFFKRGKGSRMWDVDGNEYVDYVQGMGPNIFGHAPDFIVDAVREDINNGFCLAGQTEHELEVTDLIRAAVPLQGLARFASSGTEIDQLALRVARAFTGRSKWVKFEGHYHGWTDTVLFSVHPPLDEAGSVDAPNAVGESLGMAPGSGDDIIIAPWNDLSALEAVFQANQDDIACVMMEPIMGNTNCIVADDGYLEGALDLCEMYGALLIFDEVITGFRVAHGGAQEFTGVIPHMATYGKSVAGGFPLSVLIALPEIMEGVGTGEVQHGGSFNSNVMVMSAARASLSHIAENPEGFYNDLNGRGMKLMQGLNAAAEEAGIPMLVQGIGSTFWTTFTERKSIRDYREHASSVDEEKYAIFAEQMLNRGIRLSTNARWHMSSAHNDADIAQTLEAARASLKAMAG
jgi:glutamate-1-semialdehyde 2,1-aminomutase